jgi:hypothetical protein
MARPQAVQGRTTSKMEGHCGYVERKLVESRQELFLHFGVWACSIKTERSFVCWKPFSFCSTSYSNLTSQKNHNAVHGQPLVSVQNKPTTKKPTGDGDVLLTA